MHDNSGIDDDNPGPDPEPAPPPKPSAILHLDASGNAAPRGVVVLHVGKGALVLIPQGATAACADTNGDGRGGLVGLIVTFREMTSGDEVVGTLFPRDGRDISDVGEAVLELRGARVSELLDVIVRWPTARLPATR